MEPDAPLWREHGTGLRQARGAVAHPVRVGIGGWVMPQMRPGAVAAIECRAAISGTNVPLFGVCRPDAPVPTTSVPVLSPLPPAARAGAWPCARVAPAAAHGGSGAARSARVPPLNGAAGNVARAPEDDFETFVRAHREPLLGFLRKRGADEDAGDVLQETLIRLMRYRSQPPEQLRPLMYRIGLNVLADRGRRLQSRQADAHVSLDGDFDALPSSELAHEQRIDHQQALQQVRAAILQLPPRCRQVYLLNRIEAMSYPQIARHCDISVKAVEKHVSRALRLLRASLHPQACSTGEEP